MNEPEQINPINPIDKPSLWKRFISTLHAIKPVLMTNNTMEELRTDAMAQGAVIERGWWDNYKNGSMFNNDNMQGPFAAFDDFYLNYHGAPGVELQVRPVGEEKGEKGENGRAKQFMDGVKNMTEAITGGYVSIQGYEASSFSNRQSAGGDNIGFGALSRTQSLEVLNAFQDAAWVKATMDPRGTAIINNIQFYTIGQGVKVDTSDAAINKEILEFRRMNKMSIREKNMVREAYIDGEYFFLLFTDAETGDVRVRKIPVKQITKIETHEEDKETILAYVRNKFNAVGDDGTFSTNSGDDFDVFYADIDYFDQKESGFDPQTSKQDAKLSEDKVVLFMKYGFTDELRGRVPMASILRYLKYYEDFVIDRIRLHHERAKVVWIKTITGKGKNIGPDNITNPLLSPKGGTIWIETQNERYRIENPRLDSSEAKEDGLHILYSIAAGITMPLHILEQRADEQVYASIRKADTPFAQLILSNQNHVGFYLERIYRFLIQQKVKAGVLSKKTTVTVIDDQAIETILRRINLMVVQEQTIEEIVDRIKGDVELVQKTEEIDTIDIPLNVVFPSVVQEDPLDQAKVLLIHDRLGIVSKRTMSSMAGYDWRKELIELRIEAKTAINDQIEINKMLGDAGMLPDPKDLDDETAAPKPGKDGMETPGKGPADLDRSVRRSGQGRLDNLARK